LKNKDTFTTVVRVVLLMILYEWIPVQWNQSGAEIVIYDPGASTLTAALIDSPEYEINLTTFPQHFHNFFTTSCDTKKRQSGN
jgi:hypothetical protein